MKKNLCAFLLLFLFCTNSYCQTIDQPYDYPIKPGDKEWAKFKTGEEMLKACQIPDEILLRLSTKALTETCLNYPLFINYLAFNDERAGISHTIDSFNGLKELTNRKDGYKELINLYEQLPILPSKGSRFTYLNDKNISFKTDFIELIICDTRFIDKMNNSDLVKLKATVLKKYQGKLDNDGTHSLYNVLRTLLLGAATVEKLNASNMQLRSANNDVADFIKNYNRPTKEQLEKITEIICK